MHKLEAIKFLEARLAAIERDHNDELASEGTRSEADARAEAKALAATYDFLKDCKIPHSSHCFAFSNVTCAESRAPDEAMLLSSRASREAEQWARRLSDVREKARGWESRLIREALTERRPRLCQNRNKSRGAVVPKLKRPTSTFTADAESPRDWPCR